MERTEFVGLVSVPPVRDTCPQILVRSGEQEFARRRRAATAVRRRTCGRRAPSISGRQL
jgi:hypothetical protein